jgi:hypothetical protein
VSLFTINSETQNQLNEKQFLLKYLMSYLAFLAIFLLVVGGINLLVDPQGRLGLMDVPGVNHYKVAPALGARTAKSKILRVCENDIVIFGTSRVETGLNPEYVGLGGGSVYNAGLKATTLFEINRLSDYMLRYQQPEKVLLGLDFIAFSDKRYTSDDYAESPLAKSQGFLSIVRYLLSFGSLSDSWYTWRMNRAGIAQPCGYTGFQSRSRKKKVTPRYAFDKIITRYIREPELYGAYVPGEEHYESLDQMLRKLLAADIEVLPFISPIHALQTEAIMQKGLLSEYEEWKQRVVEIIQKVNSDFPVAQKIRLWDFSGYNAITTEPLPADGSGRSMHWFHDAANYNQEVGNFVMNRMLSTTQAGVDVPLDFGVILTDSDMQQILEDQRSARARYQRDNPTEVARIRQLIESNP